MVVVVLALGTAAVFIPGLTDGFSLPKAAYLSVVGLFPLISLWYRFTTGQKIIIPLPVLLIPFLVALILPGTLRPITHETLVQLSMDFTGVLFFIYIANRVKGDEVCKIMGAYVLIAGVVALAALAAYRWPAMGPGLDTGNDPLFGNTKYPALFAFTALPMAFYMAGNACRQWQKNLFIALCSGLVIFILFSDAKVAVYGLPIVAGVGFTVLLVRTDIVPNPWLRVVAACLVVFVAVGVSSFANSFLRPEAVGQIKSSYQGRLASWKTIEPLIGGLGVGRGNFQLHYPANNEREIVTHAHNDYLELAIESPAALVFLVGLVVALLWNDTTTQGNYLKASLLCFLGLMVFWFPLEIPPLAVSFWIVLGLIYVDGKTEGR